MRKKEGWDGQPDWLRALHILWLQSLLPASVGAPYNTLARQKFTLHSQQASSLPALKLELCGVFLSISGFGNLELLPKSLHLHESHRHEVPFFSSPPPSSSMCLTPLSQPHPHPRCYSDSPHPTTSSSNQGCKPLLSHVSSPCRDCQS